VNTGASLYDQFGSDPRMESEKTLHRAVAGTPTPFDPVECVVALGWCKMKLRCFVSACNS
jgi:hypothetical protein